MFCWRKFCFCTHVCSESKRYCIMMMTWSLSIHHLLLWQHITYVLGLVHVCIMCILLIIFFGTVVLVMWRSTFENNDCALIIVCKTCSYLTVWDLYVVMTCSGAHLVRMSFIFQNVASMSSVLLLHCTLLNVAVFFNSCSEQNEHQWGCIGLQCRITVSAGTPSPAAWELHDYKGRTDVTNCEFDDIVSVVCTYITVLNDNDKQLSMSTLSNMLLWQ